MVMGARKKEPGTWHENGREDRECKCNQNPVKSASRMMSTRESSSTYREANKAYGRLEKLPYPCVLCGVKPRSHPRNSFNVVHTLCSLTLFTLRCTCMDRQSQKHVPRLVTNPHVLVQRSLRCVREAYTANTYT